MTTPEYKRNEEHLKLLKQGVEVWKQWREENPDIRPGLRGAHLRGAALRGANLAGADLNEADLNGAHLHEADLRGADLNGANLRGACLSQADLSGAHLIEADLIEADLIGAYLSGADLNGAHLRGAYLSQADLSGAHLVEADLIEADLGGADLSRADLSGAHLGRANLDRANLTQATLVGTDFTNAILTGCSIYGISAWDVNLKGANQSDLIISPYDQPTITVDNLRVAQFIYLLLNNEEIRDIIDTITSKVVLILGRFTPERKAVLDALREELRRRDYLPILFDFEKPGSRDLTETISTLARMARFVIADITDAKSILRELERIVPDLPSVPVQLLIARSDYEVAMAEHFRRYPWVLETYQYASLDDSLGALGEKVISPAEQKVKELTGKT
jgi:uncharacterized protein YjbI with pentapeptide repeats